MASDSTLRKKVALVTGATQGIGLALARTLTAAGCQLIITSRSQPRLRRIEKEMAANGISVLALACDVRDPVAVDNLLAATRARFRHIDILINNAGVGQPNISVAKMPFQLWRDVIETNLNGMFLVTKAALPLMKPGSTIINNLSFSAKRIFAGSSAYTASKHGGLGFTNTLREELRTRGIRVIALLPGATNTPMWQTIWPQAPKKKMMAPETVATAVVNALRLPANSTVEELTIAPTGGVL